MAAEASTKQAPVLAPEGAAAVIASGRRATTADRYAAPPFGVEWRQLGQLATIIEEWRDLAGRALESNVFYEPAFALAAAAVFGRDAGAMLVWSGADPRRLVGLFPARVERRRYGLHLPVLVGWTHPYAPLGVPLVDLDAAEPVIGALFAHLAATPTLPGLLLLPYLTEQGAFAQALDAVLRRAQMPSADFNRHRRASLAPSGDRSAYVERALAARKRKELRRAVRRLQDTGAVLFTSADEPTAAAAALEDFFAVEASGWKGAAGTAAVADEELRRFVQAAVVDLAGEGKAAVDRILVDGRAIAATIVLRSGNAAWFWKIAYDENFGRFSPGVMLSVALTEKLARDTSVAQGDSCATAGHPMIDHIWRERLALCDRMIAMRPDAPFARARLLQMLRSAAIARARRVRQYFR